MRKVFLTVELTDENDNLAYAIQYTGVMSRRNIYAQLTQDTGCSEPKYIKVAKWDTIDCTKDWNSVFSRRIFRHIKVNHDTGMNDNRIHTSRKLFSNKILKLIHQHVQENEALLATLL